MRAFRTLPGQFSGERTVLEPAWHLGLDEAMLQLADLGQSGEWLRVWESSTPFVVLGAGGRTFEEVSPEALQSGKIPILRRCSGGGTVLQGPGCLNFAVVVDFRLRPEAKTVDGTTDLVLGQVARALERQGIGVTIRGTSDLEWSGRKISGNAQRRKKNHALFHGTILLEGFDRDLMASVLAHPQRQPDWREQRPHDEFVATLALNRDQFWRDLLTCWELAEFESEPQILVPAALELALSKYSQDSWNRSL